MLGKRSRCPSGLSLVLGREMSSLPVSSPHPQDQRRILERLQVVYTVGYSLSLAALLLALLILGFFRWDPQP